MTKLSQIGYIGFDNLIVDYAEGDIIIHEHLKSLMHLYPLKPMTNLIVFCNAGEMRFDANGRHVLAKPGDVFVNPPNVKIEQFRCTDDTDCSVLCLSDHLILALLHDKIDIWHHAVYVNQLSIITMPEIFREELGFYVMLIRSKLKNHDQRAPKEIVFAMMRALLLELCTILETVHGRDDNSHKLSQGKVLFNRFLSLISNSRVKRQPITAYASQLAITPKYLTMLCLRYSDKTASEWVVQYTVEEIRFYLKSSNLSIKEISAKLGFSNMSHFGSYVRKHLGVSPSDFRRGK